MNDLMVFNNPEFGKIRTIEISGEAWLVGNDVAKALGYSNPRDALIRNVDEDDVVLADVIDSMGRKQKTKAINESGMYALVILSELPSAKKFKRWVTSEVLPSIRKHGGYNLPQLTPNEMMLQLATNAVELERQLGEVKEEVKQLGGKFDTAMKTFAAPGENWVADMRDKMNEFANAKGQWPGIFAGKLYNELEREAGICLSNRQKRLKTRMKKGGASRREREAITKLDVINRDKQLKSIFESIVKRYQAVSTQS